MCFCCDVVALCSEFDGGGGQKVVALGIWEKEKSVVKLQSVRNEFEVLAML